MKLLITIFLEYFDLKVFLINFILYVLFFLRLESSFMDPTEVSTTESFSELVPF
jgi:hypothetical protein